MKKSLILLFIIGLSIQCLSQSFTNGFNFCLPWDDTTTTKFLPKFPSVTFDNQHFVSINSSGNFTYNNDRIKFWGANLVAGGAFPVKTKAALIAGRLRKMGFNLIRFHHMDNPWTAESIFEFNSDTRHLNPATLDRFEYMISSLKANGVFANINLNVSRQFKKSDGIPYADSLLEMAKGVTLVDPAIIALEKEFAFQFLNHVNPYTGLALKNDPVMAMVEIVNENSLYRIWRDNKLKRQSEGGWLTYFHNRMLDSLWNKFLTDKYATTAALASAWNNNLQPEGISQIRNGDFEESTITSNWQMEQHNGAAAVFQKDNTTFYTGIASAKVTVTTATGTSWHIQFKQVGLTFSKDSAYTIQFAAKSDGIRNIHSSTMRDNSPYTSYGGNDFQLSTQWKVFTYSIKPSENNNGYGRLTFEFATAGNYWIDNIKLCTSPIRGLIAGETIELKNIKRIEFSECNSFTDKRVQDISEFYNSLQDKFYSDMKNYLVNTIGVKVPIVGTNWNVGPADMMVQSKLDYTDNHSYWDHPNFPNIPWSSTDWYINNTSMLKDVNGGTLPGLFTGTASVNMPYTISEYNHAFPNRYQTEGVLLISTYSSFHGADGIMFFDYNGGGNLENDFTGSFFSIDRNHSMMSLMPSCAYLFRKDFISPSNTPIHLNYKKDDILKFPKKDPGGWLGINLFDKKLSLLHSIRTESYDAAATTDFTTLPVVPNGIYTSDTDELIFNSTGIFTAKSKYFSGAAGYLNSMGNIQAGNMIVTTASDFGVVTWVSLTSDSINKSDITLLTVSSKLQNTNMIWDGITTIHNNWGTAPTQILPLIMNLQLTIYADSIRVYPLDSKGKEVAQNYNTYFPPSPNKFNVHINQNSNRTTWFGIEKYGNGTLSSIQNEQDLIEDFRIEQNYPNPFNGETVINYLLPCESNVSIDIFDILGKKIKTILNEQLQPGKYNVKWNGTNDSQVDAPSGIYFMRINAGKYSGTKKLLMLK